MGNIWRRTGKKGLAFLIVIALTVSIALSVATPPPKAAIAEADLGFVGGHIKDITIGAVDMHLTSVIEEFQKRASMLRISDSYKEMSNAVADCDRIIDAYHDYIEAAGAYAEAQNNGSSQDVVDAKKAAADQCSAVLTSCFLRAGNDNVPPADKIGKIGITKYEDKLNTLAKAACTTNISYKADAEGSPLQLREATFTGLLYDSYSRPYNVFDHQHREAIETGVNASASAFVKLIMAYRIQLDYVRAENNELVQQQLLSQEEATERMQEYDVKYANYVNAAINAVNNIAGMYDGELEGLMHKYDIDLPYHVLPDNEVNANASWWYEHTTPTGGVAEIKNHNYSPEPSPDFKFSPDYPDFFIG